MEGTKSRQLRPSAEILFVSESSKTDRLIALASEGPFRARDLKNLGVPHRLDLRAPGVGKRGEEASIRARPLGSAGMGLCVARAFQLPSPLSFGLGDLSRASPKSGPARVWSPLQRLKRVGQTPPLSARPVTRRRRSSSPSSGRHEPSWKGEWERQGTVHLKPPSGAHEGGREPWLTMQAFHARGEVV